MTIWSVRRLSGIPVLYCCENGQNYTSLPPVVRSIKFSGTKCHGEISAHHHQWRIKSINQSIIFYLPT